MFNENALIVSVLILVILLIIIGLNCSPKEIFTGIALVLVGSVTYLITEAAISRSGKYSKGRLLGGSEGLMTYVIHPAMQQLSKKSTKCGSCHKSC